MPIRQVVDNLWTRRILELKRIAGLSNVALGLELGYSVSSTTDQCRALNRVLRGGRPDATFIARLKKVEAAHEDDRRAIEEGLIWFHHGRRIDSRKTSRPSDLADLGSPVGVAD
jgi:hypothetical protein